MRMWTAEDLPTSEHDIMLWHERELVLLQRTVDAAGWSGPYVRGDGTVHACHSAIRRFWC